MGSGILVVAIVTGTLLLSLFYLRIENTAWPPANLPLPAFPLAGAAFGLVTLMAVLGAWANRAVQRDRVGQMKLALALAFLAGLVAVIVQGVDLFNQPFRHDTHAYGSIFWVLSIWMLIVVTAGLVFNLLAQVWAWRGLLHAGHTTGVSVTSMYMTSAAVMWLVAFGVLYVGPYFI
jgi:heme/copper-type cytochrome/quinol oxidase subunit 3